MCIEKTLFCKDLFLSLILKKSLKVIILLETNPISHLKISKTSALDLQNVQELPE